MTNHPHRNGQFELTFRGGASGYASKILGNYKRKYHTLDATEQAARKMLHQFDTQARAAHSAVIYGPGCGRDGITIP